ncbi:MAG: hypothetical protein ABJD13_20640 [Paracoccaceae bacterium]
MRNEEFEYHVSTKMDIATVLACSCLAVVLMWLAFTNTLGMDVLGIVYLEPGAASLFYGALAALGVAFAFGTLRDLMKPNNRYQPITLEQEAISAPTRPGGHRSQTLSYRGMQDVKVQKVAGNRILEIKHTDGSLAISSGAVGGDGFEALLESLSMRILVA